MTQIDERYFKTVQGVRSIECRECGARRSPSDDKWMKDHARPHRGYCELCDRKFPQPAGETLHRKRMHWCTEPNPRVPRIGYCTELRGHDGDHADSRFGGTWP